MQGHRAMGLFDNPQTASERNLHISSLDPLSADVIVAKLPEMNRSKDVDRIILATQILLSNVQEIDRFSIEAAIAILRDLGIFVGSIKKYGIEPVEAIPALEPVFLQIGQATDMIPRDTLFHYTLWNPDGERQRRYTDFPDETQLIKSIKLALPRLERAVYDLVLLYNLPLDSTEFIPQCQKCEESLGGIVEAIVHTIKNVSRQVFAEELRPYYDAITVQGKEYLGPGALDMPLFIFDHILWSTECREDYYVSFKQGLLPYTLPAFRSLYAQFEQRPSLLTLVCQALNHGSYTNERRVIEGACAVSQLFDILLKFRKPHMKVAIEAYHKSNAAREKGSGGYDIDFLIRMNALTTNAQQQLLDAIKMIDLPIQI